MRRRSLSVAGRPRRLGRAPGTRRISSSSAAGACRASRRSCSAVSRTTRSPVAPAGARRALLARLSRRPPSLGRRCQSSDEFLAHRGNTSNPCPGGASPRLAERRCSETPRSRRRPLGRSAAGPRRRERTYAGPGTVAGPLSFGRIASPRRTVGGRRRCEVRCLPGRLGIPSCVQTGAGGHSSRSPTTPLWARRCRQSADEIIGGATVWSAWANRGSAFRRPRAIARGTNVVSGIAWSSPSSRGGPCGRS
jgi:hypothetical protein